MSAVGVVEMLVGIVILTGWTRIGANIASAWLLSIAFNLVLQPAGATVFTRSAARSAGAEA
jgi:hypothetical protein